jgi:thymidine phosphorylase
MIAALGGPKDFIARADHYLPQAPVIRAVEATGSGFVTTIATRNIGVAVVTLGGGRSKPDDAVDPTVGFTQLAPIGMEIRLGEPLGFVHARNEDAADEAAAALRAAYRIGPVRSKPGKVVLRRVGNAG